MPCSPLSRVRSRSDDSARVTGTRFLLAHVLDPLQLIGHQCHFSVLAVSWELQPFDFFAQLANALLELRFLASR